MNARLCALQGLDNRVNYLVSLLGERKELIFCSCWGCLVLEFDRRIVVSMDMYIRLGFVMIFIVIYEMRLV